MVGEVISIQHIAELPTILPLDGNHAGTVYYIGGLNVMVKFINTASAKAFYENENNWNRWFKWLKMGFNDDVPQERITWVKIYGLPIRFRTEDNIASIANKFGKVLEITNFHWQRFDLSCGEVCIITRQNTIIDEEVTVTFENNFYRVGVVEYDRDWTPFDSSIKTDWINHDDDMNDYNDEDLEEENSDEDEEGDDDQNSKDDGIPPSVEIPADDPPEEGDIVEESGDIRLPVTSSAMACDDIENCENALNMEVESSHRLNNIERMDTETLEVNIAKPIYVEPNFHTSRRPASLIPLPGGDEWPVSPDQINDDNPNLIFGKGDLIDKRRKIAAPKSVHTYGFVQSLPHIRSQWDENTNIDPPKSAPLLYLNNTASIYEPSATHNGDDSESSSSEFSKLIQVGNSIGFQVSKDDPIVIGIAKGGNGGQL
uniref:DUF4283 domain-containing protein n=1 Tax=Lactuca sativa TaxID=4236 RepID=A0A9R1VZX7_LACSA|nr:hypothetical protein LSAT_V11C400196190 [Lactuca sativa]